MKQTQQIQKQQTDRHKKFLRQFKTFPDNTRKPIYIQQLRIPLNYRHFSQLNKNYQLLVDHTLDKQVTEIMSAIGNWNTQLKIQWIPGIIYPFVKLFKKDALAQFQISLTYLANWCSPWFRDYPAPPIKIIDFMSKSLKKLQKSVNQTGVSLGGLVWPMFLVNFTDVFTKQQWLQLFDFLILRPQKPWLLLTIIIELLRILEFQLCKCKQLRKMHCLLRKQRKTNMKQLIEAGIKLAQSHEQDLKSNIYKDRIFPICKDRYPIIRFINKQTKIKNMVKQHQDNNLKKLEQGISQVANLVLDKQNNILGDNNQSLNKYSEKIQLALRNHLQTVEQTHQRKIKAFKQVEDDFREILKKNEYYRQKQTQTIKEYVHKRSVLQKAITQSKKEGQAIKKMQINKLQKLKQILSIKQQQQRQTYHQLHAQIHKK